MLELKEITKKAGYMFTCLACIMIATARLECPVPIKINSLVKIISHTLL